MSSASGVLVVEDASVAYGGVVALDGVSIRAPQGAITGLIGPNGAGKTTFIDAVTGFADMKGRIEWRSTRIERWSPQRRARAGVCRTWQSGELFHDLTVWENVLVGAERFGAARLLRGFAQPGEWCDPGVVETSLATVGLSGRRHDDVQTLPHGQQKLVSVARALATSAGIICMDEPAAGLDTRESRALGEVLQGVAKAGVGILLVDHDMSLVLSVCHYVYVLEFGRLIAEGVPEQLRNDERVVRAYLGTRSPRDQTP